jgi:hypothetical protein
MKTQTLTNLVSLTGGFNMSKLRNLLVAFLALSLFSVLPAFAQGDAQGDPGCKTGMFIGSYTHLDTFLDVWGDGSNVENQTIRQLTLHSDGTAIEEATGIPDLMLSTGTISSSIGSWTCRDDGKLVVTLIFAVYAPTTDAVNHPSSVPNPPPVDLLLGGHRRRTSLFSVTGANSLTRIQSRIRRYSETQDPTDPTGGVLGPLLTNTVVYTRLVASDVDLLAP